MPRKRKTNDGPVVFTSAPVEIGDDTFSVRVHWARVGGQLQVVGLDLRSFFSEQEQRATLEALAEGVHGTQEPMPRITTAALRGLRFAEVVQESLATAEAQTALPYVPEEDAKAVRKAARPDPDRPRRGPAPGMTTEYLRTVVAPAYMDGGAQPVEQVREAMERQPPPPPSPMKSPFTKEQARKAVVKARALGFIPPYDRRTR